MHPTPQFRNRSIAGTPNTWSWDAHGLIDRDFFARLTRAESGDESESVCNTCCAPKLVDSDYVPYGHIPMDEGWNTFRDLPLVPPGLLSTPRSSWQPYADANASKGSWVFRRYGNTSQTDRHATGH